MTKRLESVDLELLGQQHSFRFDPAVEVEGYEDTGDSLQDEIAMGNAVLRLVTSLEVQLAEAGAAGASVDIEFTYTYSGRVSVDLDSIEEYGITDESELRDLIEQGEFEQVYEDITYEVERNVDGDGISFDDINVSLTDENGEVYG